MTTSSSTTILFNLGTTPSGTGSNGLNLYVGDLLSLSGNVNIGDGTQFAVVANPTAVGDYRLIGGNPTLTHLGSLVLPSPPSNFMYNIDVSNVDPGYMDLVVTQGNSSQLTLPATMLTFNQHVGDSNMPASTTVTNGNVNYTGHFTPSSSGTNGLIFNPSGSTNVNYGLPVTLNVGWANTTTPGPMSGQITISNDDNTGDTSTPKTQAVTGGVYAYAAGAVVTNSTVTFGNYHVGATPPAAQFISVQNTAADTGGYTEMLDASFSAPGAGIVPSGSISLLAPQTTDSTDMGITINTNMVAANAGSVVVNFTSDGTGTSNLVPNTPVGSQTVTIIGGNVYSGQATWTPGADNNWSTQTNWTDNVSGVHVGSPGIAGFNGDTATFNGTPGTVTLDVSPTLASLTLSAATNTGFTIAPSDSNRITLSTGLSGAATLIVTSGSHTISAPVTVTNGLTVSGAGSVTLSGSGNTFNGSISIGTGMDTPTLVINAGSSVNSNVAQGVTATVAAGATLELAGSMSALVDQTNATDPHYRASVQNAGTLQIGDASNVSTQQVGGIDPDGGVAGSVVVTDGSSLTADHINQTSLVIGNGSTFTLAPSDMNGNPMAAFSPGPAAQGSGSGLILAGSLTPSSSFVAAGGSLLGINSASSGAPSVALGAATDSSVNAVPEPSGMLLLGLGGLAVSAVAMRRRRVT